MKENLKQTLRLHMKLMLTKTLRFCNICDGNKLLMCLTYNLPFVPKEYSKKYCVWKI